MNVFGWLCLLAGAGIACVYTIGAAMVYHGFTGRIPLGFVVPLAIDAALIYATCVTFPFSVTLTQ